MVKKINDNLLFHSSSETKILKFIHTKSCVWITLDLDGSVEDIKKTFEKIKNQSGKVFIEIPQFDSLRAEHCIKLAVCNICV